MMAKIITICGSMSCKIEMSEATRQLEREGNIVLGLGTFNREMSPAQMEQHERLHLNKIKMSDSVLVVTNRENHVGKSTMKGIAYAMSLGMEVHYDYQLEVLEHSFMAESEFPEPLADVKTICISASDRNHPFSRVLDASLTEQGHIVLRRDLVSKEINSSAIQQVVDALQDRRIEMCDELWVIDGGTKAYCTKHDGAYATKLGKPILDAVITYGGVPRHV
jgi:hypothetical protein